MPFESVRQIQTCYGKQLSAKAKGKKFGWDCDEWLTKTVKPQCLPTMKGEPKKCRPLRNGEKVKSPVYEGPRGGMYFYVSGIKVYVPKDARDYVRKNMKILKE